MLGGVQSAKEMTASKGSGQASCMKWQWHCHLKYEEFLGVFNLIFPTLTSYPGMWLFSILLSCLCILVGLQPTPNSQMQQITRWQSTLFTDTAWDSLFPWYPCFHTNSVFLPLLLTTDIHLSFTLLLFSLYLPGNFPSV